MKITIPTIRCSHCKAQWVPRIANPMRCPRCGNKL